MKIRTLIAQCAAIGALPAGGLALTTGTAQAAVNCNALRSQISSAQASAQEDYALQMAYTVVGNWDQAIIWADTFALDEQVVSNLQSRYRMAHCA